jgi:hypothetical protein
MMRNISPKVQRRWTIVAKVLITDRSTKNRSTWAVTAHVVVQSLRGTSSSVVVKTGDKAGYIWTDRSECGLNLGLNVESTSSAFRLASMV